MSRTVLAYCICGSKKRYIAHSLNIVNQDIYKVRCPSCGRETVPDRIKENAIFKWNAMMQNYQEDR